MNLPRLFICGRAWPNLMLALSLIPAPRARAASGGLSGSVVDPARRAPLEMATATLRRESDDTVIQTVLTGRDGAFAFEGVPPGLYQIELSLVGGVGGGRHPVRFPADRSRLDVGALPFGEPAVRLEAVSVVATRPAALNSIDRKVYNLGRDILSTTGSVTDALQGVPSVDVDLDGNISLRGSPDVLVLIDGRTSALMGASRAAVLGQMPANTLDRIEVITNPSAKFRPDGTAGIINLVPRKAARPGLAGSLAVNAGNGRRANTSLALTFAPARWKVTGDWALRQDDRRDYNTDTRALRDPATGRTSQEVAQSAERWRPVSKIARSGVEFRPDPERTWSAGFGYLRRTLESRGATHLTTTDPDGTIRAEAFRDLRGPEAQEEYEFTAGFRRAFAGEDHVLDIGFSLESEHELEDSLYATRRIVPGAADTFEAYRQDERERASRFRAEYSRPLPGGLMLETGCSLERNRNEVRAYAEEADSPIEIWPSAAAASRFRYTETIRAGYAMLGRSSGRFGVTAGLRLEQALLDSQLASSEPPVRNDYARAYPTLHLQWALTPEQELQFNYSRRVRRPDGYHLNPFPEYRDPTHLWRGNPRLKPEDIHSLEVGYQFRRGDAAFVATGYYRHLRNGFSEVTTLLDNSVLQTMPANLATSRSLGVELAVSGAVARWAAVNFSGNTSFGTFDASNIGLAAQESSVSWNAKLGATLKPGAGTSIQFTANFASGRLTPQGRRSASFVANIGLRREFAQGRLTGVLTVTDLFRSMREQTIVDLPGLRDEVVHRHGSPTVYAGIIYRFGAPTRTSDDDGLPFDDGE